MSTSDMLRPVWKIYRRDERRIEFFRKELGISDVCAQLLLNRGVRALDDAQQFLYGTLDSLPDPSLLKDMDRAVARIKEAVSRREKILIYGDYDVDGVTSCALLGEVLDEMGADWEVFIPNRLEEGYGLGAEAVVKAARDNVKLLVTVDCGINSIEEVRLARQKGMDVIVTDHHEVKGRDLPEAFAVVDPHRPDCAYPYKGLAGVGVVYKLASALLGTQREASRYLDLVALGSVADVVPLSGENRILVKFGLAELAETRRPGLKALLELAGLDGARLNARSISFGLAPRINAMGRMGSAACAFELLVSRSDAEAARLAGELDRNNRDRRKTESEVLGEVLSKAEREVDTERDKAIVLAADGWHPGVIGIVAARISERYGLPAVLITFDGDVGKGSGRGVDGMDLFKAIQTSADHLIKFGGHEQACGLSIRRDKLEAFRNGLNDAVGRMGPAEPVAGEVRIDYQLPFSHISRKLLEELRMLMPYGQGNAQPLFATGGLSVRNAPRNIGRNGYKFIVSCGNMSHEAISFKRGSLPRPRKGDMIDLVYDPSINEYRGIESIQLNIRDLRISGR